MGTRALYSFQTSSSLRPSRLMHSAPFRPGGESPVRAERAAHAAEDVSTTEPAPNFAGM